MKSEDEVALEDDLAEWGKVILLETRGRMSGHRLRAAVGFVEEPGGSLLVAAGNSSADWVLNLRANPRCIVRLADRVGDFEAQEVDDSTAHHAIVQLILKYGTPAERLGSGPVFRLRPTG